jgi:hypothetical protein
VFTASAWPEQALFWSADYPREAAADSLVRRLPFVGLGALAAAVGEDGIVEEATHSSTARLLVMIAAARRWRSTSTS